MTNKLLYKISRNLAARSFEITTDRSQRYHSGQLVGNQFILITKCNQTKNVVYGEALELYSRK